MPGYQAVQFYGMFVPGGTPARIVSRLNQEMVQVLNRPDVKEKFLSTGVEVIASSPEQSMADMKAEIARMSKVIRNAGISLD